jgi:anti-sigma factor RsiW
MSVTKVTCQDLPTAAYVDGELGPIEERAVERHLEGCPSCRALVADLRTVRAAAFTLDRREPPADLLARIQARVAAEPRAPGRRLLEWPNTRAAWGTWLAAAATLLLATTIGVAPLLRSGSAPGAVESAAPGTALVDSVQADLEAAEQHYDRAIQGLEQIARSDTSELDPQVAAVLQKNLQVVDQAIDESRAALRTQPSSATAQDGLFEAMRTKVALLQQTVELINEMRKGNQAEAGRLMQDLSR